MTWTDVLRVRRVPSPVEPPGDAMLPLIGLMLLLVGPIGCVSPPSVSPLLRSVDRVLGQEVGHLEHDARREAEHFEQTRRSLAEAFDADLAHRPGLDAEWVRSAAAVYAAAREELARHEERLRSAREARADNLRAAMEAQRRALWLLEQRDRLVTQTLGPAGRLNPWRLP